MHFMQNKFSKVLLTQIITASVVMGFVTIVSTALKS